MSNGKNYSDLINEIKAARQQKAGGADLQKDYLSTDAPVKEYDTLGGEAKLIQKTQHQKCPSCGASLVFKPSVQGLFCEYCENVVKMNELERAQERELSFSLDKYVKWHEETRVFNCKNCGAQNVFDKNAFATKCAFCDSASIVEVADLEGVRPNAVVPFALEREDAKKIFKRWIRGKFFAPSKFKKKQNIEDFKAVYSPSWTFDSNTVSVYNGTVGDYYYVTVGYGKYKRVERRVRYRPVSGTRSQVFDDININSSREINDAIFNRIKPFMTQQAVAYDRKFLAGYIAEHYRLPLSDGWLRAKEIMDRTIYKAIVASLRCDVVQSLNVKTQFSRNTFKYVLLPLFIIKHLYKNKTYYTYINGRTGKAAGDYPISAARVIFLVVGILAVIVGIPLIMRLLEFFGIYFFS